MGWALVVFALTGQFVPDTAIAKQNGHVDWNVPLSCLRSLASLSPMWEIGFILLPLIFFVARRAASGQRPAKSTWNHPGNLAKLAAALGLVPFLATLASATAVGQAIHGA